MRAPCVCLGQRAGGQQDPHVGTLACSSALGRAAAAVERGATTLSYPPSSCARLPPPPGPRSLIQVLSVEFPLCGPPWASQPPPCTWGFKTEPSGPGGKVDEHFLSIFLPGGPPLALPSPPLSQGRSTLNGS